LSDTKHTGAAAGTLPRKIGTARRNGPDAASVCRLRQTGQCERRIGRGCEAASAIRQQDSHAISRDGNIDPSIAVEIARGNRIGKGAGRKGGMRRQHVTCVAAGNQDGDRRALKIHHDQIGQSVSAHIAGGG
jgi:hypothetical protein